MFRSVLTGILLFLLMTLKVIGANPELKVVFEDSFIRKQLGSDWRVIWRNGRGPWIRKEKLLFSHGAKFICTKTLPADNIQVSMDISLASQNHKHLDKYYVDISLRSGEAVWGGGGIREMFGIKMKAVKDTPTPRLTNKGHLLVSPDKTHKLVIEIKNGTGSVSVDGKMVKKQKLSPKTSELNRFLGINSEWHNSGDASIDNVNVFTGSDTGSYLKIVKNSKIDNKNATIDAGRFIDPSNPAIGIQKAIDSLPPAGGAVIIPEGTFIMRRHLKLPSNVSLRGQGVDKTILKAYPARRYALQNVEQNGEYCTVTISDKDAAEFKVGDGVSFAGKWSHPANDPNVNIDCFITLIKGNKLTVKGIAGPKPKMICRWYPLIFSRDEEFVEIKDLTLAGSPKTSGVWGGFEVCPITFGRVAGMRVSRVSMDTWKGDGLSFQNGADGMVTDCTATGMYQGFHPGTDTFRFVFSRNLSTGNKKNGLYFCYHNRNGIYFSNTVDAFEGYAWPQDKYNIIFCNKSTRGFRIEQGFNGTIFNNIFKDISVGHGQPKSPTRHFLVAQNVIDSLSFDKGSIKFNLYADNRYPKTGQPVKKPEPLGENLFSAEGANIDPKLFPPIGVSHDKPVKPPVLLTPVLDGRSFYDPDSPDCGFQKALDKLKGKGGTLLLPGGRYGLRKSLKVDSKVTLTGRGTGTVLYAADQTFKGPLITVSNKTGVTISSLTILGEYRTEIIRNPAIALKNVKYSLIDAVDIRGWAGIGIESLTGEVMVCDCRIIGCAGSGLALTDGKAEIQTTISRSCLNGFQVNRTTSRFIGNIAGVNRENGYLFESCREPYIVANNASFNGQNGLILNDCHGALVVANTAVNNNQQLKNGCGYRLTGTSSKNELYYNSCADDQPRNTQQESFVTDETTSANTIRFNIFAGAKAEIKGTHQSVTENQTK